MVKYAILFKITKWDFEGETEASPTSLGGLNFLQGVMIKSIVLLCCVYHRGK